MSLSPPLSQTSDKPLPNASFLVDFQKHCFYVAIAMLLGCNCIAFGGQKQWVYFLSEDLLFLEDIVEEFEGEQMCAWLKGK